MDDSGKILSRNENENENENENVKENDKLIDIFWVVENATLTQRYIKATPIRYLHPSDQDKKMFRKLFMYKEMENVEQMRPQIDLLYTLFRTMMEFDNAVAFSYITKRFGLGIAKRKCENLIKKVIDNNAINIMKLLIANGIDITQGDHIAFRYAHKVDKDSRMVDMLRENGASIGLEKSMDKFKFPNKNNIQTEMVQ